MTGLGDSEEACNVDRVERFVECEVNSFPTGPFPLTDSLVIFLKTFNSSLLYCNALEIWSLSLGHKCFAHR